MLQLKEVVKTLQQNVDSGKTRISIKQKSMFQDFIEFNSRQPLK